jgi:hypothetical protein
MHTIRLSRRTVTRLIGENAADLEESLRHRASEFDAFSLAIDVSDTAKLAVLVHGVDAEFKVTEGIICIQPVKDTVTGEDIFK